MNGSLRLLLSLSILLLAACERSSKAPLTPNALVGTESVLQVGQIELLARVSSIDGKIITSEVEGPSGEVALWEDYRGLFRVGGVQPDNGSSYRYELEFDQEQLESIFPLAVGKKTTFRGVFQILSLGVSFNAWINIEVTGEKTIIIDDEKHTVFIVEILQEMAGKNPRGENVEWRVTETLFFDPKISMVLRRQTQRGSNASSQRVKSIKMPGDALAPSRLRQRRSGTVML